MPGEVLDISIDERGALVFIPAQDKQAGWTDMFNAIADSEEEIMPNISNEFDEDNWTW